MKPFAQFPQELKAAIRYVLTDIDGTLTLNGRLPAAVFEAMERLQAAGIRVLPITGRPAGWCDHLARMWPIDAVVGENGAFYFAYDDGAKKMIRRYWKSESERIRDRRRLDIVKQRILSCVAGCAVAADQAYREADLAIDYCEDVAPLTADQVQAIVKHFEDAGARAKVSSIHVNGWFGDYDKLSMTRLLFAELWGETLHDVRRHSIFTGDSPNDIPMFAHFPHAVGVANIRHFEGQLTCEPGWVTSGAGGRGFAEMVAVLLAGRP
jgi:HAD superfamily hydrolase (TIGR01484 family)